MAEKITASEYRAKLIAYHKDKEHPKLEINHCGNNVILKRTYCEEFIIKDIDLL